MTNRGKTVKKRVGAVPERQNDEGVEGRIGGAKREGGRRECF